MLEESGCCEGGVGSQGFGFVGGFLGRRSVWGGDPFFRHLLKYQNISPTISRAVNSLSDTINSIDTIHSSAQIYLDSMEATG